MNDASASLIRLCSTFLPKWPLLIWLVAIALAIGLADGLNTAELIGQFNAGFGRALGEFTLILLPSLVLAATMSWHNVGTATGLVVGVSPPGSCRDDLRKHRLRGIVPGGWGSVDWKWHSVGTLDSNCCIPRVL